MKKIYMVRKYVLAKSAKQAINIEKNFPVDDVWAEDSVHRDVLMEQLAKEYTKVNAGF